MSFWMMHLRIAELMIKSGLDVEDELFYVGSIAPDSGRATEERFKYIPSKQITHWHKCKASRLESNFMFYDKYLSHEHDYKKRSFYLGYFSHIVTDTFFVDELVRPIVFDPKNIESWEKDPYEVQKDWFNGDYLFIEANPSFVPYKMICRIKSFENIYLDYFDENMIFDQIRRVAETYSNCKADHDREYKYMPLEVSERFIPECAERLMKIIKELNPMLQNKKISV